jgi:hypothetical protein
MIPLMPPLDYWRIEMLSFSLKDSILTVIEHLHSANSTQTRYWYYNIDTWHKNRNGREGEPLDLECDDGCINWVKKHYFTKVGLTA